MKQSRIHSALSIVAALAGCAVDPGDAGDNDDLAEADDGGPVSDDTVFVRTTVRVASDGSTTVEEPVPITAGEQRARNAARLAREAGEGTAQRVYEDPACAATSFWLFSRTDWTGNQICFVNDGAGDPYDRANYWVRLADYSRFVWILGVPRYAGTWELTSGSAWPGNQPGSIGQDNPFQGAWYQSFKSGSPRFVISSQAATSRASYVDLNVLYGRFP